MLEAKLVDEPEVSGCCCLTIVLFTMGLEAGCDSFWLLMLATSAGITGAVLVGFWEVWSNLAEIWGFALFAVVDVDDDDDAVAFGSFLSVPVAAAAAFLALCSS